MMSSTSLPIKILYFAYLREQLGVDSETLVLQGNEWTIGKLRSHLRSRGGVYAQAFAAGKPVKAALNQTMVEDSAVITSEAEIAFFPPVTGG